MTAPTQTAIDFGRINRDRGIEKSLSHADAVHMDWRKRAYSLFKHWIARTEGEWMMEDFRGWAEGEMKLETPPTAKSYGGLAMKAAKAKLIASERTAKVKNPKANCANAAVWKRKIKFT